MFTCYFIWLLLYLYVIGIEVTVLLRYSLTETQTQIDLELFDQYFFEALFPDSIALSIHVQFVV